MSGETQLTIIGNLTADPELRFTSGGAAVCSFTLASTPRFYDKNASEWKDGEALFMRVSAWREMAENLAEGLRRGDRVIAVGRLQQRSFETKDGDKRTVVELQADEVGPSARFKAVRVLRTERESSARASQPAADPWGSEPEPPF